jgi:hypothetical protein
MAWWIARKGSELELLGRTEVSEDAAKRGAVAMSNQTPGVVFQVRYHVNANGKTEVRWEAVDGRITEITGEAERKRP